MTMHFVKFAIKSTTHLKPDQKITRPISRYGWVVVTWLYYGIAEYQNTFTGCQNVKQDFKKLLPKFATKKLLPIGNSQ